MHISIARRNVPTMALSISGNKGLPTPKGKKPNALLSAGIRPAPLLFVHTSAQSDACQSLFTFFEFTPPEKHGTMIALQSLYVRFKSFRSPLRGNRER